MLGNLFCDSDVKYAYFIHVLIFSDNTEVDFNNYFNVVFSVPRNILNKHGLEHITFLTNNGLNNKIECGLLCIFNNQCDFFMYTTSSSSCYLASYNTTDRGLSGDWIDSSEQPCYQNSSKIISFCHTKLTKIISLKIKPLQRMASYLLSVSFHFGNFIFLSL